MTPDTYFHLPLNVNNLSCEGNSHLLVESSHKSSSLHYIGCEDSTNFSCCSHEIDNLTPRQKRRRMLSEEELAAVRAKDAWRQRQRRSEMSEQKKAMLRVQDAMRQRERRRKMIEKLVTEEEKAALRAKEAARQRFRRQVMAEQKKSQIRAWDRFRKKTEFFHKINKEVKIEENVPSDGVELAEYIKQCANT